MAVRTKKDLADKETSEKVVVKKRSRVLTVLLFLFGTVAAAGLVIGALLYFVGIPGVVPKLKAPAPLSYETVELGERVVNLADAGGGRYLRVRMVLEFKKNEKLAGEIKEKNAQIMDAVLKVLRSKTVDEVMPLDREEKVKAELMSAVNGKLKNGKVERIYFTDFLIQ